MCDKKIENRSKVCDKKNENCSKVSDNTKYISSLKLYRLQKVSIVVYYLILFYLKEQETIEVVVDDGAIVQIHANHRSLPKDGISKSYTTINTFFQLSKVIFECNTIFLNKK